MIELITEAHGNLLASPVEALVNTVNTQGVMGKGIALQFKRTFPEMFKEYKAACTRSEVALGTMHVWATHALVGHKYIINFPTKGHWKSPSRLKDIETGLDDLTRVVKELNITSIAIPPLGCGNGGLDWADVEPLIQTAFSSIPQVDVQLFAPGRTPSAREMKTNTTKPNMTPGKAALLALIERYRFQAQANPSLIETQKLMYFMQEFGEPLRLKFDKYYYGPYADNLRHVLINIEGHYMTGYGDGNQNIEFAETLEPLADAREPVERELESHPETKERMLHVLRLIEGYESTYGMELLSTVHWVARHAPEGATDDAITAKVSEWSPRKSRLFPLSHVERALKDLRARELLSVG